MAAWVTSRETGAAQHLRDARITMIYEGTNGIQALDLVRRKLQQDDGAAAAALVADMRETAHTLADAELGDIARALSPAADAVETATDWLRATWRDDPVGAAAGATPYADMMGFVAGGWLLAKAAIKARMRLARGIGEHRLLRGQDRHRALLRESVSGARGCARRPRHGGPGDDDGDPRRGALTTICAAPPRRAMVPCPGEEGSR